MSIALATLTVLALGGLSLLGYSFWKASRPLREAIEGVAAGDRPLPASFRPDNAPSRVLTEANSCHA